MNIEDPIEYGNELSIDGTIIYPAHLDFTYVKKIAQNFAKIIFDKDVLNRDYNVGVKLSGLDGLTFIYTTTTVDEGKNFLTNQYVITLEAEWEVVTFLHYWNVDSSDYPKKRRCENLFRMYEYNYLTPFYNAISELIPDMLENINLEEPFVKNELSLIYSTDCR